jgi:hypothetical protein
MSIDSLYDGPASSRYPLSALARRWISYHRKNPSVWDMFERFSLEAARKGRRKFSGWLIINRMRWEYMVEVGTEEEFKISNDFIAIYVRMFQFVHPALAHMFDTAQMKRIEDDEWRVLWRLCGVLD